MRISVGLLIGSLLLSVTAHGDSRVQMWYHWVNDAVETDSLAADLSAMRDFGVSRAHLFFVKQGEGGVATTVTGSDDWLEKVRFALARARECGIDCSFHNAPGWTGSGGPWIEPKYAAKEVTSAEIDLVFPLAADVKLPRPWTVSNYYHDVATVAFRLPDDPAPLAGEIDPKSFTVECSRSHPVTEITLDYPRAFAPRALGLRIRVPEHLYLRVSAFAVTEDGRRVSLGSAASDGWHMTEMLPYAIRFEKGKTPAARRFVVAFERTAREGHWGTPKMPDRFEVADLAFTTLSRTSRLAAKAGMTPRLAFLDGEDDRALATNDVVEVTAMTKDGRLSATALPPGRWRVLRLGYTITGKRNLPATPGGAGLDCEKLSRRGLDRHWQRFVRRILDLPEAKDVVKSVVIDSWDCEGQNWTADMLGEFRRRRGYDLKPYLPVFAGYNVISDRVTSRVLFDFACTVSDLYAENYFDYFSELCRAAGVESVVEPYAGPFDGYRAARNVAVPTSEFWLAGNHEACLRFVSSVAHVNGRTEVAAESFTTGRNEGRWSVTPAQLKESGDRAWAYGINRFVVHSYVHQPASAGVPGLSLGVHGTQLNRHTTWWREGAAWSRYVEDGQRFLSEGAPRAQVLVLSGCSNPNANACPEDLAESGYDFDFCGPDDLARLTVREGRLRFPSGATYEALWLGSDRALTSALLAEVERIVRAGGRVAAGTRPWTTPSHADDIAGWQRQVDRLWTPGGVTVASGARAAMDALGLQPAVGCSVPGVRHLRRVLPDGTLLLYVWHPGAATEATFKTEKGTFVRPLAHGANFFRLAADSPRTKRAPAPTKERPLEGPWTLALDGVDASADALVLTNLVSWSELRAPLCYHAGRGTYRTTFELKAIPSVLRLDLGDVRDVATVFLNGKRVDCLWYAPYACDIASFAQVGRNELEVEVVNGWPNRLIGDACARAGGPDAPADVGTKISFDAWSATDALLPAGMLGPVRLCLASGNDD